MKTIYRINIAIRIMAILLFFSSCQVRTGSFSLMSSPIIILSPALNTIFYFEDEREQDSEITEDETEHTEDLFPECATS